MSPKLAVRHSGQEDLFIRTRFQSAEIKFLGAQKDIKPAIEYNNRLARHWKPGISTRSKALEMAELETFIRLMAYADSPRPEQDRPDWNPMILDLGGGTGKVVEWLRVLGGSRGGRMTYLYTDISPDMKSMAALKFKRALPRCSGYALGGHFALADITFPLFLREDWDLLRKRYFPIVTVCAGGTIGNFGALQAEDHSAQKSVLDHYLLPADLALVTFLDAGRIGRSLKAYASFGRKSGLYDGQNLRVTAILAGVPRKLDEFFVSFSPTEFRRGLSKARRAVAALRGGEFWIRLEMTSKGVPVGQVTRHFSRHYARNLVGSQAVALRTSCDRAVILGFQPRGPQS